VIPHLTRTQAELLIPTENSTGGVGHSIILAAIAGAMTMV